MDSYAVKQILGNSPRPEWSLLIKQAINIIYKGKHGAIPWDMLPTTHLWAMKNEKGETIAFENMPELVEVETVIKPFNKAYTLATFSVKTPVGHIKVKGLLETLQKRPGTHGAKNPDSNIQQLEIDPYHFSAVEEGRVNSVFTTLQFSKETIESWRVGDYVILENKQTGDLLVRRITEITDLSSMMLMLVHLSFDL